MRCSELAMVRGVVLCLAVVVTSPVVWAANAASKLLVGIPSGLPGYEAMDGNQLKISDPYKRGMTECISARLNATFVWIANPTKRIIQSLHANELDLIYPMGFTEERADALLQSEATWQNPDALVSLHLIDMGNKSIHLAARLGSPQQTDYVSDGYQNMTAAYAYEDLARLLARRAVDAVIVPRSVYNEQRTLWPAGAVLTLAKPRRSGFYLNRSDPKRLLKPLNDSIAQCRKTVQAN